MTTTPETETLKRLYHGLLRIRRAEERILELLLKNKLSSTMCHVSIGQEAVAVGVCDVLAPEDYITSTHRGHGHFLARGGSMGALMAELMGRETGACRGRGSSMHLVDVSIGHLGSNAIVGGHIPIATGAALWARLRGEPRVVAAFFGDGATSEGIFHESVNFAAVQRLPIVFVVENNHWAMSLPWSRETAQPSIAAKAQGYAVAGVDVDGQDVLAVRAAAREAVERARNGDGPTLLGVETYRFLGHSRADPSSYRDKQEEERWRLRDPLVLTRARLGSYDVGEDWFDGEERVVAAEISQAVDFAEASAPAALDEVFSDIYAMPLGGAR
jgi:acetoin:2,6-dichlorophenolindophenol oxidoreductase subunit alpha